MHSVKKIHKIYIPEITGLLREKTGLNRTSIFTPVMPMLAFPAEKPFDNKEWVFEVKWDGYRIICTKEKSTVRLTTRNLKNYSYNFFSIMQSLKLIQHDVVIDGEVVILRDDGIPDLNEFYNYKDTNQYNIFYYMFDLLWIDGFSLLNLPLVERKNILKQIIPEHKQLRYNEHIKNNGKWLFSETQKLDMEGIIAKKADSIYLPGERTESWLKIQTKQREEYIIGGWVESENESLFKSLLIGRYHGKELHFHSCALSNIKDNRMLMVMEKLKKHKINKKPFVNDTGADGFIHWVNPVLVGEFEYEKKCIAGKIQNMPVFKRIRNDKTPANVYENEPEVIHLNNTVHADIDTIKTNNTTMQTINIRKVKAGEKNKRLILQNENHFINSAPEKYYSEIAEYILPYLKDRPLSLQIKQYIGMREYLHAKKAVENLSLYQHSHSIKKTTGIYKREENLDQLICSNKQTLLYAVNLGCIDFYPWNSRAASIDFPDYAVINIDTNSNSIHLVVQTALAVKEILDSLKIKGYPKTSGGSGIHVYIPLQQKYTHAECGILAGYIARLVHKQLPGITTLENNDDKREMKIFIDWSNNKRGKSLVSAYSVRPFKNYPVSTPLDWSELTDSLNPNDFNIYTIPGRLSEKGDLFKGILSKQNSFNMSLVLEKIYRKMLET